MERELIITISIIVALVIFIAVLIVMSKYKERRQRKRCIGVLTYVDESIYFGIREKYLAVLDTLKDGDVIEVVVRRK